MNATIITRDELRALIERKADFTLLDVREKHELTQGMIPGAHNIPLHEIPRAITLQPKQCFATYGVILNKTDDIIVYCRSGARSEKAAAMLAQAGFKVRNFKGSVLSWSEIDPHVKKY